MSCYSLIYKTIQNNIKDIIITKLLDKIMHFNKEISKYKEENTKLKSHYVFLLKNSIQQKTIPISNHKKLILSKTNILSHAKRNYFRLKKINSLYLDTEILDKSSKINHYSNTTNGKNKPLSLDLTYLRNENESEIKNVSEKTKEFCFFQTDLSSFKHNLTRKQQQKEIAFNTRINHSPKELNKQNHISQVFYYKTNSNLYTPIKSKWNDSMISLNLSMLGTANYKDRKKDKKHNLIKIHKKTMSQNHSFTQKT